MTSLQPNVWVTES